MSKSLLLLLVFFLAGCESVSLVDEKIECTDILKLDKSFISGIKATSMDARVEYRKGFLGSSWRRYDFVSQGSCAVTSCNDGYTLTNTAFNVPTAKISAQNSLTKICIPTPTACQEITPVENIEQYISMYPVSDLFKYSTKNTIECNPSSPLVCDEDQSIDSSNENSPACVPTVVACSSLELSEGAISGTKTFNTALSSYGTCMIDACAIGSHLELNSCVPNAPVLGCMDSRADNYNPDAVQSDMSCMCSGNMVYNPETGCTDTLILPF